MSEEAGSARRGEVGGESSRGVATGLDKARELFLTGVKSLSSSAYGLGGWIDRARHNRNAAARGRPPCAIVSVGGITVGGAGKTPVAAGLARDLAARGWRVVLASRGYKGAQRERVKLVSDGRRIHASVAEVGDEALLLAAHAPGVPVLVGRDRHWVGHHAVSVLGAQILVLDDAFQHHRLIRDIDCVCLDGRSGAGSGKLLPAGPLREPVSSLARADWVIVVDGAPGDAAHLLSDPFVRGEGEGAESEGAQRAQARRVPTSLMSLDRSEREPVTSLSGRRVGILVGIAQPGTLRRTLTALGAEVVAERRFPDHHVFKEGDLRGLDPEVPLWITTEKDGLKILPEWAKRVPIRVLRIEAAFDPPDMLADAIEAALQSEGRLPED
ncbi:MAG: tetraacyldisaccharide 4'-kinase [Myxococcota bacterium]